MSGIAELIQATVSLGDAGRASALYQQLAPFSGRIVTACGAHLWADTARRYLTGDPRGDGAV
jgi:hypothetical protein